MCLLFQRKSLLLSDKSIFNLKKIILIFRFLFYSVELIVLLIIMANFWVISLTKGHTYTKISKIPYKETALVLGTSPKTKGGNANPYFISRMDATALLYHYGKINEIIVSGEKSPGYDETLYMKNYLVSQEGIPENAIVRDTLGFNTQKSISRCKDVYAKNDIIIVSQGYHNMRALFYARNKDMDAIAFDARSVNQPESYYRNQFREAIARVQAVIYYITGYSLD